MSKVITLNGLRQSDSLDGWDKCEPVETEGSDGNAVVRCAGSDVVTLSGKHSDKELTEIAKRDLVSRYPDLHLGSSCKPTWKTMKNGKRRCRCGNRFVKSEACSRKAK
jgi:hypothetical protein